MNSRSRLLPLVLLLSFLIVSFQEAWAGREVQADPVAVGLIQRFLGICTTVPDLAEAGLQVVAAGLVHASRLDANNPNQLNGDALRFSFKKAHDNAKFYDTKIVRVTETTTTGVGFGPTAQKGKLYKYFVAKKPGVNGMPAPVQVFFPEAGGAPVLYDWGSF